MATLYISEFPGFASIGTEKGSIPGQPSIVDQAIALGAVSVASNAFSATTNLVMVSTDTACGVTFGGAPVATATSFHLPANVVQLFAVSPGQKVAAITP
jgi:hypothetical protein